MILRLFNKSRRGATIQALYGAIVAQARNPVFYRAFGIPDTVNGRYDMIVLHLALLLERAERDPRLHDIGQEVFDRFLEDLDDHFREQGVGDLRVPREMQKLAEAFYGRRKAYRDALAAADHRPLEMALARNIYADTSPQAGGAEHLARYVRAAVSGLAEQTGIVKGGLTWPDPAQFSPADAGSPV